MADELIIRPIDPNGEPSGRWAVYEAGDGSEVDVYGLRNGYTTMSLDDLDDLALAWLHHRTGTGWKLTLNMTPTSKGPRT